MNTYLNEQSGLAIIIPAYNERDCIADTLDTLRAQTLLSAMVVVTDDFSSDGTREFIEENYPEVTVIRPERNLGSKAKAQNFALFYKLPNGEYLIKAPMVVTIDADTSIDPTGLEELSRPLRENPEVKAACGTVIPANPDNPYTLGRLGEYLYAFAFPKRVQQEYGGSIYIVSGCFGCYDTRTLRGRGGWHTTTMAEDMDLTASYHRLGYKVAYAHKAICRPIEPFNWKTYSAQMKRWSAAFFQNVSVHWKTYATRPAGIFAFVSFLDAGLGGVIFTLMPIWLLVFKWRWVMLFVIGDVLIICLPVIYMGLKLKMVRLALKTLPFIFYLRLLNTWFWFRALWLEWIRKQPLDVYVKGH